MVFEFPPQTLEHGFSRFFDLKEQGSAVAAHEQADGTESPHASNADDFERDVLERVSLDETTPLRCETLLIGRKHAPLIYSMLRIVALSGEMINERRSVVDPRLVVLHQVREIVVLLQMFDRLGNDGGKLLSEGAVLNALDFSRQINPAVPNFER